MHKKSVIDEEMEENPEACAFDDTAYEDEKEKLLSIPPNI